MIACFFLACSQVFKEDFKSLQVTDKRRLGPTRSIYTAASIRAFDEVRDPKSRLNAAVSQMTSLHKLAVPRWRDLTPRRRLERLVHSTTFEAVFIVVIIVNMIPIGFELADATNGTNGACRDPVLQSVNYLFLGVYLVEYALRLSADRLAYLPGSIWGFIDTFVILIGIVTVITNIMMAQRPLKGTAECLTEVKSLKLDGTDETDSDKALGFIKVLRVTRIVRLFRLFRFLLPANSKFIRNSMNAVGHAVFEECAALTAAQCDIKVHLEKIPITALRPLDESSEARTNINVFLGQKGLASIAASNPGIEVSVRTKQAATGILNAALDRLDQINSMGFLEDHEVDRFSFFFFFF